MAEKNVEIYADEVLLRFDRLLSTNERAHKQFQKIMSSALSTARKVTVEGVRGALKNDPRASYQGVRAVRYKKIVGGNVNILDARRGAAKIREYNKPRKLQAGQWGGNRRARSAKTEKTEGYYGSARAFVLRLLEGGTKMRSTMYGTRGQISGWRFFKPAGLRGMERAKSELGRLLEEAAVMLWK